MSKQLTIDGANIDDIEGFWNEVLRAIPWQDFGRNLDAFNDILRGGDFTFCWLHSERSRRVLGYEATVKWLSTKIERCHPQSVSRVQQELDAAKRREGPTLFDILIEIIQSHGPGVVLLLH